MKKSNWTIRQWLLAFFVHFQLLLLSLLLFQTPPLSLAAVHHSLCSEFIDPLTGRLVASVQISAALVVNVGILINTRESADCYRLKVIAQAAAESNAFLAQVTAPNIRQISFYVENTNVRLGFSFVKFIDHFYLIFTTSNRIRSVIQCCPFIRFSMKTLQDQADRLISSLDPQEKQSSKQSSKSPCLNKFLW